MGDVRVLAASDGPAIAQILNASQREADCPIGPVWTSEQLEEECRSAQGYVSTDSSGRLEGFILYRDIGEIWEISFLATAPEDRGRGVMGRLFSRMLLDLPSSHAIWLEVHEQNRAARSLYEKLGFRQVGTRPRYYSDGGGAVLYNIDRRP